MIVNNVYFFPVVFCELLVTENKTIVCEYRRHFAVSDLVEIPVTNDFVLHL